MDLARPKASAQIPLRPTISYATSRQSVSAVDDAGFTDVVALFTAFRSELLVTDRLDL